VVAFASESLAAFDRKTQLRIALFVLAPLIGVGFIIGFLPLMMDGQGQDRRLPPVSASEEEIRVQIDLQPLGGGVVLDEVRSTVKIVYVNEEKIRSRVPAFTSCGLQVSTSSQWSGDGSLFPTLGDRIGNPFYRGNCLADAVGETFDEYTEHVLSTTRLAQYFYPFDGLILRIVVGTKLALLDADRRPILVEDWQVVNPRLKISLPGWIIEERFLSAPRVIEVELQRPLYVRLITPLILVFLLAAVLTVPLLESLGDSMQLAIATALFIWGAHDSLVPKDAPFLLFLDVVFLCLEVMAIAAMLLAVWFYLRSHSPRERNPSATSR
jgi:hypothetical protein